MNKYQVVRDSKSVYHILINGKAESFIRTSGLHIFNHFESEQDASNYIKILKMLENKQTRKILFRAKTESNIWVYGSLVYTASKNEYYIVEHNEENLATPIRVQEKTIGQYIGLCDKNEKEIFEGDIIVHDSYPFKNSLVAYGKFNFSACDEYKCEHYGFFAKNSKISSGYVDAEHNNGYSILASETNEIEILGNIYDNPELLFME